MPYARKACREGHQIPLNQLIIHHDLIHQNINTVQNHLESMES
jgi:hypothetical protein